MADVPGIVLTTVPAGPQFPISEACQMPSIAIAANLAQLKMDPTTSIDFSWTVTLEFHGSAATHSAGIIIRHTEIRQTTSAPSFTIPFSQLRGGKLEVTLKIKVGGAEHVGKTRGLEVTGTNPSIAALHTATKDMPKLFTKIIQLESGGGRQFLNPSTPLFSSDDLSGVGLCQITPYQTPEQVWSWKENLAAGWRVWQEKARIAKAYPAHVRKGARFLSQVKAWNVKYAASRPPTAGAAAPAAGPAHAMAPSGHGGHRTAIAPSHHGAAAHTPSIPIDLPNYSDDQLDLDTVRGYNGYSAGYHEFRVKLDGTGLLVVTLNKAGTAGSAEWERITPGLRRNLLDQAGVPQSSRGDVNYVNDVERQTGF